jgi:RHS repeat-associated protein
MHAHSHVSSRASIVWSALFFSGMIFFFSIVASAQDMSVNPLDGYTPAGLKAGSPAGNFPLSGFDTVNPFNGNLNFSIPLLQVGGRGTAGYTVRQTWNQTWTGTYSRIDNGMGGVYEFYEPTLGGFQAAWYSPGSLAIKPVNSGSNFCTTYGVDGAYFPQVSLTRLAFLQPDGTSIELRDQLTQGAPASIPTCPTSNFNRGKIFTSVDGESATFISDDDIEDMVPPAFLPAYFASGYLKWKDGTVYRIDGGDVTWIRDRNGNKVSFGYVNGNYTITDQLKRTITVESGVNDPTYGLCNRIKYKGFGGADRTIWITFGSMSSVLRSGYSIQNMNVLFPLINASNYAFNPNVITKIVLPNGKFYQFYYNSYMEIARVELPTGGAYEYDYGTGMVGAPSTGAMCSCQPPQIYRRLWEKRIYSNGGTGSSYDSKTTLSRPESYGFPGANDGYVTVNQYNSSSTLLTSVKHYYYGAAFQSMLNASDPTGYGSWSDGKEYQTDEFASNGTTLLKRVETGWSARYTPSWYAGGPDPSGDPRITSVTTTLSDTNQVAQQTFGYDQFNNQTAAYEYDYGNGAPGALIRSSYTTYVTTNNSVDYTADSIHIRDLPSQSSVYDGGGTEKVRVSYEYDNYAAVTNHAALLNRTNISNFDSAFDTSYTTRGNATGITRYLLSGGSVTGSVSTYSQHDIAGNTTKSIDGRGNVTELFYDDCFGVPNGEAQTTSNPTELGSSTKTFAFLTKAKNALNQYSYAQYDYYLGSVIDFEDLNGIVASGYFNDSLDRPTEIKRAVGTAAANHTVFAYDEINRIITTTADLNTNNDGGLVNKMLYDLMGRTIETRQYEGGGNYIAAQVQYDTLGRAYKTSNPFRPYLSETAVWTTRTFDGLSRVTSVTTPDSAVASTAYSGNAITITDEAGKLRRSINDALGRLKRLDEPDAGNNLDSGGTPVQSTSYTYDVFDNLISVTQGVQTRTFVYDSLKRLISTTYPEAGTTTYGYDANGNLTSKVDARSITTTITYDAVNRITSKSYNDSPQTPTINYFYDTQTLPSGAPTFDRGYATGRLVAVTYGSGSSTGGYRGYDQMGRVVRQYQRTGSVNYLVEATYFANSSVQTETYPAVPSAGDRRSVSYTNDSAGRLASLSSSSTTYAPAASVSSIGYAAHNALSTETYGNGLVHAIDYNNRLQPTLIKLGTSGSPVSLVSLGYGYGSTNNNGNVLSHTYAGGGLTYTQNFGYDSLNRLTTSSENSGSNWSQTNAYDRYGNRWVDLGGGNQSLYFSTSTNRISGYSYDTAGNLLNDGTHSYTYDAENKIAKVDSVAAYEYDGAGLRVRKLIGENLIFVYGIGGQLVAEYSGSSGALLKEYVYGADGLLATIEPAAINSNGTRYTTPDHLGSPRVVTNSAASVISRHDYLPFGDEIGSGVGGRTTGMGYILTSDAIRQKFTAKERDTETGLDFFGARYYQATQGRFTSVDPWLPSARPGNPQRWNRYSYTLNNPLRFTDPTGMQTCCDDPDAPPDYKPEFRPCTVGVEAGCSEDSTVLGAVTIVDKSPEVIIPVIDLVMAAAVTPRQTEQPAPKENNCLWCGDLAVGMHKRAVPMAQVIETYAEVDLMVMTGPLALGGGMSSLGLEAAEAGTEGAGGFDLALGLAEHAEVLADETGSLTYSQVLGDATFVPENFAAVADEARTIRFTTQGFDWARWGHWARTPESWSPYLEHVTNYELHQVLTNPNWLAKTVFY